METLNLVKDQKIDLTKTNPGITKVKVGLGWNVNAGSGDAFDLDACAVVLKETGPRLAPENVLYFKQLKVLEGALVHSGDNLTGEGDGDDEVITVDLSKVPAEFNEVVFAINVYDAIARGGQTFGRVSGAGVRIYNGDSTIPLASYDLNEDYSSFNSVVVGKLYRHSGEWKFQALGEGRNGDLNTVIGTLS